MSGDEQMGLNPFEEEEHDEDELLMSCWRLESKVCGPDCVAYDERCRENPVFNPCLVLNLQRAQAKSLSNIAEEMKRQNDFYESDAAQLAEREGQRRVEAEHRAAKAEAEAYAAKVKEMDKPPPEIK
jgi:hypothetical protein